MRLPYNGVRHRAAERSIHRGVANSRKLRPTDLVFIAAGISGLSNPDLTMKYEYWKSSSNGNWYWHVKAANGEGIAQGEGYISKHCEAIRLVKSSKDAPENEMSR
jgi:uncharacterized protein YegP (UPF0339 family)